MKLTILALTGKMLAIICHIFFVFSGNSVFKIFFFLFWIGDAGFTVEIFERFQNAKLVCYD